jgi:hypothetical protein
MRLPFYISQPPPGTDKGSYYKLLKEEFGGCTNEGPKHEEGDLKTKSYFAWLPTKVCGKTIWLRGYEVLYEYQSRNRAWGRWVKISERL